jgi:hypothetical protein
MAALIYHMTTTSTSQREAIMVDWTILSPTFLTAVVEWAGAVVTVLAVGPGRSTREPSGEQ